MKQFVLIFLLFLNANLFAQIYQSETIEICKYDQTFKKYIDCKNYECLIKVEINMNSNVINFYADYEDEIIKETYKVTKAIYNAEDDSLTYEIYNEDVIFILKNEWVSIIYKNSNDGIYSTSFKNF